MSKVDNVLRTLNKSISKLKKVQEEEDRRAENAVQKIEQFTRERSEAESESDRAERVVQKLEDLIS